MNVERKSDKGNRSEMKKNKDKEQRKGNSIKVRQRTTDGEMREERAA